MSTSSALAERKDDAERAAPFEEMDRRDLGWLEAYMDSEGTLTMVPLRGEGHNTTRGFSWRLYLTAQNTDSRLSDKFDALLTRLAGFKCTNRRYYEPSNPKHSPAYRVDVTNRSAIRTILSQVSLISKEEQRVLLLEAELLMPTQKNNAKYRGRPWLHEGRLIEIHNRIVQLNRRGR